MPSVAIRGPSCESFGKRNFCCRLLLYSRLLDTVHTQRMARQTHLLACASLLAVATTEGFSSTSASGRPAFVCARKQANRQVNVSMCSRHNWTSQLNPRTREKIRLAQAQTHSYLFELSINVICSQFCSHGFRRAFVLGFHTATIRKHKIQHGY